MHFTGSSFLPRDFRRAFTLLELLVVIGIITVLSAVVLGAARHAAEMGRVARAREELAALVIALENYRRVYGDYPQTDDAAQFLQSLIGKRGPAGDALQDPAWLDLGRFATSGAGDSSADPLARLLDPWFRPYIYIYKVPLEGWTNPSYILYSAGPDGIHTPAPVPGEAFDPSLPGNADNVDANGG